MGLEPTNLLTASQALYQLSYAPEKLSGYQAPSDGSAVEQPTSCQAPNAATG